jgi:hypothetical protein
MLHPPYSRSVSGSFVRDRMERTSLQACLDITDPVTKSTCRDNFRQDPTTSDRIRQLPTKSDNFRQLDYRRLSNTYFNIFRISYSEKYGVRDPRVSFEFDRAARCDEKVILFEVSDDRTKINCIPTHTTYRY